jgi:hypothetical protein
MYTNKKWFWLDERKNTKHSELIRIAMETSFKNKNTRTKTCEKFSLRTSPPNASSKKEDP